MFDREKIVRIWRRVTPFVVGFVVGGISAWYMLIEAFLQNMRDVNDWLITLASAAFGGIVFQVADHLYETYWVPFQAWREAEAAKTADAAATPDPEPDAPAPAPSGDAATEEG